MSEPQKPIESLHDLVTAFEAASAKFGRAVAWWRGESSNNPDKWKLRPRLFRKEKWNSNEGSLMLEFQIRAPSRYSNCPAESDSPLWMFLAQHHKLPTRLLDWTESPFVAAFFATQKPNNPNEKPGGVIWALNPSVLNQHQSKQKWAGVRPITDGDVGLLLQKPLRPAVQAQECILSVAPPQIDLRFLTQQSVFTVHGISTPLDQVEKHEEFLVRYEIPESKKDDLARQLSRLGFRISTLFPTLDYLGEEISDTTFIV